LADECHPVPPRGERIGAVLASARGGRGSQISEGAIESQGTGTPERRFHYRGDLAHEPLPELLYAVYRYRVPGVIQASSEQVVKRIYVKDGNIVHAVSSDRQESLGHHLLSNGHISREDFLATMRARSSSDERYGELLVERDILAPADIYRAIRLQSAEVVWDLFTWSKGEVAFAVGEFPEPSTIEIQIPVRQAIKEGIKRISDARPLLGHIGKRDTVLEASYRVDDLIEVALRADEYQLLKLVDGKRTLFELCSEGPFDSATNGKLLYAYYVLRFVRRSGQKEPSGAIKLRLSSALP
jgi:hypothetical protein